MIRRWRRLNLWRGHDYFYDAEAVRSPMSDATIARVSQSNFWNQTGGPKDIRNTGVNPNRSVRKAAENVARRVYTQPSGGYTADGRRDDGRQEGNRHAGFREWDALSKSDQQARGANLRNVWSIATQPYKGSHFATFPEELPRLCILAGSSEHGVCGECGPPWERATVKTFVPQPDVSAARGVRGGIGQKGEAENNNWDGVARGSNHSTTLGWRPTCEHDGQAVPAIVLDPFVGSGTALLVAQSLGRQGVGLDLSPEYLGLAVQRIGGGNRTGKGSA